MKNPPAPLTLRGACDASGGVSLGGGRIAVGDDEWNRILYYDLARPGEMPESEDWAAALDAADDPEHPECDLESAAELGGLIYWIGSHAQSKGGKTRRNRHRLLATRRVGSGGGVRLERVGGLCKTLRDALIAEEGLREFGLAEAARIAPKLPGGFNIESLCGTPRGELLIGFRNPVPEGRALLVPLTNPRAAIDGAAPEFGPAVRLDLGGLGMRDMVERDGRYLILAGATGQPGAGAGHSRLYAWEGGASAPRAFGDPFAGLNPEALILHDEGARVQVLSDDGTCQVGGRDCKDEATPAEERSFRTLWVDGWPGT